MLLVERIYSDVHKIKPWVKVSYAPFGVWKNGVPQQVTVLNTPLQVQENMDGQFAVYAQDSWRLNNFTINYGVRYDRLAQSIVGQEAVIEELLIALFCKAGLSDACSQGSCMANSVA